MTRMRHVALFVLLVVGFALGGTVLAQGKRTEIALDQIWAYDMPGTRDVRELEPDKFGEATRSLPSPERFRLMEESQTYQIRRSLKATMQRKRDHSTPGFAVRGIGADALTNAYGVIVTNNEPRASFSSTDEITVVFFTGLSGRYVHIKSVSRQGEVITVEYECVEHLTKEMTIHFALLPLGELPAGKYQVNVFQVSGDRPGQSSILTGVSESHCHVSKSFAFLVVGNSRKP